MTSATVPMISPDGQTGDIPRDRAQDAIKAGFKPAMAMTSPDGRLGYIPQDRANDAIKAGFKVGQPAAQDKGDQQGFVGALKEDLTNMVKGAPEGIARMLPGPQQYFQVKDAIADAQSLKDTGMTLAQRRDAQRKAAGYSLPYRMIAPVGEAVGVNASGMEDAAAKGDSGAILGHAAAAAAPYVVAPVAGEAVSAAAPAIKAGARAAAETVAKVSRFADPDLVGIASPRAGNALRTIQKIDGVLQKYSATTASPAASVPANTSVPASSLSMTQFPPPMPKDPINAAPLRVKAILDDAEAQIKQVVADGKQTQPTSEQPAAPGSREDKLDDRALSQEMGWGIARQYFKGIAEQRDMAASALSNKTELTTQAKVDTILAKAAADARTVLESAKIPAEGTKARIAGRIPASWVKDGKITAPQPGDDLVDLLQRSIDAAKAKKPTGSGSEGNGGAK